MPPNLLLFYYEYTFIKDKLKTNYGSAYSYRLIARFDLLIFNNPSFEENIAAIYPPELVLKKTTESANSVSCLDMQIDNPTTNLCLRQT